MLTDEQLRDFYLSLCRDVQIMEREAIEGIAARFDVPVDGIIPELERLVDLGLWGCEGDIADVNAPPRSGWFIEAPAGGLCRVSS